MKSFYCLITLSIVIATVSCGGNENVLRSGKATPAQAQTAQDILAEDLSSMKTAGFTWIYLLRRKDGAKIDAEDRGVIRQNTTDANRRVATDDDKAFLIGTNTPITPEKMMALYGRFAVEDHSPPPVPENANINANANT